MADRATIAYQPALDGVRALAVVAVLLFHAEVPGFDGGYLGVSVFFTLSGYLITSLLVTEHHRSGAIDLPRFYGRRVRRLLPASAVCLVGIVVLAATTDVFAGVADLRRQVVGSVLQVANWVFLAGDGSYQDLFQRAGGARSPLEHFWSLAIEEQFYWVWPPVMLLILGRVHGQRSRVLVVGGLTAAFAVAAPVIAAVWGPDAAYWATPARIAEILVGALLAVALHGRSLGGRWAVLAPASLAALVVCVVVFPPSSGPAYEGWLPAIAVASAGLIAGLQVDGPLRRALSFGPLVWIGTISYGLYLYHWPVYVVASAERMGVDGPVLVVIQLAITLAISVASAYLVELPIRHRASVGARWTFGGALAATGAVVVAALVVVPGAADYWQVDDDTATAAAIEVSDAPLGALVAPPRDGADPSTTAVSPATSTSTAVVPTTTVPPTTEAASDATATTTSTTSTSTTSTTTTEPPLPELARPVRIVVAGDSTANATGAGLVAWAAEHPELAQVVVDAAPGCGFLREGERKIGEFEPIPIGCWEWEENLVDRVEELQPDVVVLLVTSWDLLDYRFDGETRVTPLDPVFRSQLDTDYRRVTDLLLASGAAKVAWIQPPIPNVWWMNQGTGQEDPARHAVANTIYEAIAADQPDRVGVVPLATWLTERGWDTDEALRPDGVHWDPAASLRLAEDYLGERLVRIAVGSVTSTS